MGVLGGGGFLLGFLLFLAITRKKVVALILGLLLGAGGARLLDLPARLLGDDRVQLRLHPIVGILGRLEGRRFRVVERQIRLRRPLVRRLQSPVSQFPLRTVPCCLTLF